MDESPLTATITRPLRDHRTGQTVLIARTVSSVPVLVVTERHSHTTTCGINRLQRTTLRLQQCRCEL